MECGLGNCMSALLTPLLDRLAGILHRLLLGGAEDSGLAILLRQVTGIFADALGLAIRHTLGGAGTTGHHGGNRQQQYYFLHDDTYG